MLIGKKQSVRALKNLSYLAIIFLAYFCTGWSDTWDGIKKGAENIKSVQADFIQEKHMKILVKPFASKGVFRYRVPGSLRWEYTSPIQSVLLMHKNKSSRYIKGSEGFVKDSSASLEAMRMVLEEISSWLAGNFNGNPDFHATLPKKREIVLTPKRESISKIISRIVLSLSDTPGLMKSVMIYESEDSFTKLVFVNPSLNESIPESVFLEIE